MKNSAINNLGYTGVVTLSRYVDGKKTPIKRIKNSGGNSLFNFLSNCLLGDFETAKFELPAKIMLLRTEFSDDGLESTTTSASGFIYFLTKPERLYTDTGMASSTICYSFVIPMDIIENTEFNGIGLYPEMATELDVNSFAAICQVDGVSGMRDTSSVLVVDWRLTITNNG